LANFVEEAVAEREFRWIRSGWSAGDLWGGLRDLWFTDARRRSRRGEFVGESAEIGFGWDFDGVESRRCGSGEADESEKWARFFEEREGSGIGETGEVGTAG
jgi:hypothetical protein